MTRTTAALSPIVPAVMTGRRVTWGFTTRNGGVSRPPFDSLNLGLKSADDPDAVRENHARLYRFAGVEPENVADMGQVHGDTVRVADCGGTFPETDGLITATPGILLGVRTADCPPLLLFDPERRVAAAVHCGWRSITAGIAEKTVRLMRERCGSNTAAVAAAIGPAAGACCYEVGNDVAGLLDSSSVVERDGALHADLKNELRIRLLGAGLASDAIETVPDCTICAPDLFFSHRRDGDRSGRQMGFIMIR